MTTENPSDSGEILLLHQVSRDIDRDYVVRCPHCYRVIGLEGDNLDAIRGKKYQHRRCGGWLEVSDTASFAHELPEAAP